jgi:hypothetical protein
MKRIGTSVIAFGVVSLVLSLVGEHSLDCGAFLLILAGSGVRNGSRAWTLWAIVLSIFYLYVAIAVAVATAVHGVNEIGLFWPVVSPILGLWAWLNWTLLSGIRASSQTTVVGGSPIGPSPRPFQFTLRSMFVLTLIAALACWTGTRPLPPDQQWGYTITSPTNAGSSVMWSIGVVGSHSGVPATGYLWRDEKTTTTPERIYIETVSSPNGIQTAHNGIYYSLVVDGKSIEPGKDFQLFVNDSKGNLVCLRIPRDEAIRAFGRPLNQSRIEEFWKTVVVPQRDHSPQSPKP